MGFTWQETYLFRAACSELSTEIKNNRRLQDEEMRQQRTHLQYEVDILTQSLNQELLTLTDNVRGVFNDRKMVVSQEQKTVESAVCYKHFSTHLLTFFYLLYGYIVNSMQILLFFYLTILVHRSSKSTTKSASS